MKNLFIFDFFGVICNEVSEEWAKKYCTKEDALKLRAEIFDKSDVGLIDVYGVVEKLAEFTGLSTAQITEEFLNAAKINQRTLDIMQKLRKRHKVAVLSNAPKGMLEIIFPPEKLLDYADIVVISYQEKIAKPTPEIYQKTIAKFEEKFDQVFMIDDRQKNLDPMIKMGHQGILFTTPEALETELKEYL